MREITELHIRETVQKIIAVYGEGAEDFIRSAEWSGWVKEFAMSLITKSNREAALVEHGEIKFGE